MNEILKDIIMEAVSILVIILTIALVTAFTIAPLIVALIINNNYWMWGLVITIPLGISTAIYIIDAD